MAVLNKLVTKLAKPVVDTVEEFLKTFNKKVYHGTQGSDVSGAFGVIDVKYPDGTNREVMVEMEGKMTGGTDPKTGALIREELPLEQQGINAFQGVREKSPGYHPGDMGTWVTDDPDVANYFAGDIQYGGNPTVYPLQLKMDNPIEYDTYEDLEEAFYDFGGDTGEFTDELINRGYDGIQVTNSTTDVMYYDGRYVGPRTDYVVFDGRQLRSPFAGFDPKKADSRRILSSGVGAVSAGGVAGALGGLPNGDVQR
jgi:hypothetical protein